VSDAPVAKIYLFASGDALLDERPITREQLALELAALARRNGIIWYARQDGDREPTAEQLATFEPIMAAALPIALFIDRDFKRPVQGPD
jgi:hypothetical protein